MDLEAKHNCNINLFFGSSDGYVIVHAMRNYIRFPDFRLSHFAEAIRLMALVAEPRDSVVGQLELAQYVREVVPLKEILLAKANR